MATRTASAGSTTWTAAAFSGGAATTAADEVVVPTGSTLTISAASTVLCRSLSVTGTGTLVFAAATSTVSIGDAIAGTGNVALSIASGATITLTASSGVINFISTSTTQQTITTGGKTLPGITINGVGSSYVLGDALTQVITGVSTTFDVLAGTFDTANYTCTFLIFRTFGSSAKTLTLGSSLLNIYRNASAMDFSQTLPTITANTAHFVFKANATINPAGLNMNGASLTFEATGGTFNHQNGGTWANLTVVNGIIFYLQNAGVTVTGTFTANGAAANNRLLIASTTRGASRSITAATVAVTNADFMDIDGAGAGNWNLSAITGLSGDCGGNSGITFTTPVTQTSTGTGSFTWSTHGWTTRVPLPQDDVVIPNAFLAGRSITADRPRMGKNITCTCTGNPNFLISAINELYGSLTMASGMTATRTETLTFAGRGTHTITSNGVTFVNPIAINGPGGTYTLQDAFITTNPLTLTSGTLDTNNQTVRSTTFISTGSVTRALTLGTSTYNLTSAAAGTVWNAVATGFTLSASASTIVVSAASANARSFVSGNKTYGTLSYTVAASTGSLSISGSSAYETINVSGGTRSLLFTNSGTYTITGSFNVFGTAGNLVTVASTSAGNLAILSKPSGGEITTASDYLSIRDIRMIQPYSFFAGANSNSVSNTFGIVFGVVGTYRHTQSAVTGVTSTSATGTFLTATTPGNLLIAHTISGGSTGGGIVGPAGWTLVKSTGTAPFISTYMKIADGTETTATYSQTTTRALVIEVMEYSGFTGVPTLDVIDSNTSAAATSISTTATTGPTNTAQPALAFVLLGGNAAMSGLLSTTNGFIIDSLPGNTNTISHAAIKERDNIATVETTLTWQTSRTAVIHLVVITNVPSSAGSGSFFPFF